MRGPNPPEVDKVGDDGTEQKGAGRGGHNSQRARLLVYNSGKTDQVNEPERADDGVKVYKAPPGKMPNAYVDVGEMLHIVHYPLGL